MKTIKFFIIGVIVFSLGILGVSGCSKSKSKTTSKSKTSSTQSLKDGEISDTMNIPDNVSPGDYYVISYSSSMYSSLGETKTQYVTNASMFYKFGKDVIQMKTKMGYKGDSKYIEPLKNTLNSMETTVDYPRSIYGTIFKNYSKSFQRIAKMLNSSIPTNTCTKYTGIDKKENKMCISVKYQIKKIDSATYNEGKLIELQ